ncbi:hypothetical protein ACFFX1_08160 [Dactylosporangium sucinum]|uniref:hypothetical protein n=1 Tax=Dactylosporangium sucinum TaxID=1424081 RepID=UPI00167D3235|nr:hypothetical protein [Dactylosporangium sucinum]
MLLDILVALILAAGIFLGGFLAGVLWVGNINSASAAQAGPAASTGPGAAEVVVTCASEDTGEHDYGDGAWHLCGAVVPALAEDNYSIDYRDGAWHLSPAN